VILGFAVPVAGMFLVSEPWWPYTQSQGNKIWNVDVSEEGWPGLGSNGKEEIFGTTAAMRSSGSASFNPKEKPWETRVSIFFDEAFRVEQASSGAARGILGGVTPGGSKRSVQELQ